MVCPNCGTENPARAKFCFECGTSLAPAMPPVLSRETRRVVTVVFCDLVGSTGIGERLDVESTRQLMARYYDALRVAVVRHGGTVEKFIGDAVMAVFGLPERHEDDALRAVRAAVDMRAAVGELDADTSRRLGVRLQVRIGANTGEVIAGDAAAAQFLVTGDAVNVAARLQQMGAPDEILLGETTARLVRDATVVEPVAELKVKGRDAKVVAYRLADVLTGVGTHKTRTDTPLVGRERELRSIVEAWERVVAGQGAELVTVIGPPGVGKSRLVAEAASRLDGARVLTGQCLPYGEGITFRALEQMVREAVGITARDDEATVERKLWDVLEGLSEREVIVDRLMQLLGWRPRTTPSEETAWAVRYAVNGSSGGRPTVLVFDDLQWAEPSLLDLIEQDVTKYHKAKLLIICVARVDLVERRSAWGQRVPRATMVELQPLSDDEAAELIANLLPGGGLADSVRSHVTRSAEGNPLFLEQMLTWLVEDGLVHFEDGSWRAIGDLSVRNPPPSIQALIAARLDRLDQADLRLLERASVVGTTFEQGILMDISPEGERERVPHGLTRLTIKDFVELDATAPVRPSFAFRHRLVRDVAYESMPKHDRVSIHECVAHCYEARARRGIPGYEGRIGLHLDAAQRYRTELGPVDDTVMTTRYKAAAYLAIAGRKAMAVDDMVQAIPLLARALELLKEDDGDRIVLMDDLGNALVEAGELARAEKVFTDALELARASGLELRTAYAELGILRIRLMVDPASLSRAVSEVSRCIEIFERVGDDQGLARAWILMSDVHWARSAIAAASDAAGRAVGYAAGAGDSRIEADGLGIVALCSAHGPTPVDEGIRRCEEILALPGLRRSAQARAMRFLGLMRAMAGDADEGRALVDRSMAMVQELGLQRHVGSVWQVRGMMATLVGDHEEAVRAHRRSYEILSGLGDTSYASTAAALLARALNDVGRPDEAEEMAAVARETASLDDLDTQMEWRLGKAGALVANGDLDGADALAREALAISDDTDINMRGDVLATLADIAIAAGRFADAEAFIDEAVEDYRRKGNTVAAAATEAKRQQLLVQ